MMAELGVQARMLSGVNGEDAKRKTERRLHSVSQPKPREAGACLLLASDESVHGCHLSAAGHQRR